MQTRNTRNPWLGALAALLLVAAVACGTPGDDPVDPSEPPPDSGEPTDPGTTDPGTGEPGTGEPGAEDLHVRKSTVNLSDEEISAWRTAVATMKARAASDPTSWLYQANIHGTWDSGSLPAWNTCQHGSYFFLSWHRMYLYYFERILRDASGDPDFSLPYWNYTEPGNRALPLPLRDPADASNPLFVAERAPGINGGAQLPPSSVRFDQAFAFTNFTSPTGSRLSFGGQQVPGPVHFSGTHGQIEGQPHDIIHVMLGGRTGWMSDPNLAARDPVFWIHHANIDRLWQRWLEQGGGRANPVADSVWMDTTFEFFDENGDSVQLTGSDILETVGQLDYRYDDAPASPATESSVSNVDHPNPAPRRELAASGERVELGTDPVDVTFELSTEAASEMVRVASSESSGELALNVEGISYDRPGVYYEIYMNLPDGTEPDANGPYYVGNLAYFGHPPEGGHEAHGEPGRSYRLTEIVEGLTARGEWSGETSFRFVMRGLEPADGQEAAPAVPPGPKLSFKRLSISTE